MLKFGPYLIAITFLANAASAQTKADPVLGQAVFKQKCSTCHSDVKGKNGMGPSLYGVYGSPAAAVPGYNYSPALKASGLKWTPENLTAWLTKPKAVVPGTKMAFVPPTSPADKANLIAYLKTKK